MICILGNTVVHCCSIARQLWIQSLALLVFSPEILASPMVQKHPEEVLWELYITVGVYDCLSFYVAQ